LCRRVVAFAHKVESTKADEQGFKPHIYQHSYKLAQRKERKERERIEEVLAMTKARSLLSQRDGDISEDALDAATDADKEGVLEEDGTPAADGASTMSLLYPPRPGQAASTELSHSDIMYARALLKRQNLQRIAREVEAKAMQECTFQPKVNPPTMHTLASRGAAVTAASTVDEDADSEPAAGAEESLLGHSMDSHSLPESSLTHRDALSPQPSSSERGTRESIHRRLYGLKDKIKSGKLAEPSQRIVEEMQACTFAPRMASSFSHRRDVKVPAPPPPTERAHQDAEKSIHRVRAVHEQRVRKAAEDSHEAQQARLNECYARSRELARKGAVPFKFTVTDRVEPKPTEASPQRKRGEPE
jgi:hypothetical protein